jgi:hypothetical protein
MLNPRPPARALNRARISFSCPTIPALNLSSKSLCEGGIQIYFDSFPDDDSKASRTSIPVTIILNLLRTSKVADAFKRKLELSGYIGECVVWTDSAALTPFRFTGAEIERPAFLKIDGETPDFCVSIRATYNINGNL